MWSYQHKHFTVHQLPVLFDNFIYLIDTGEVLAAVDPAEAAPVLGACEKLGQRLTHVLNTHHHWDHTGGNIELQAATGCTIVGAARDAARIPGIELQVSPDSGLTLGGLPVGVLDVPGHTLGHIAYVLGEGDDTALFCGDTLFGAGCGRLFEGEPEVMWASLQKLMQLPPATRFYCAHEYTLNNLEFCLDKVLKNDEIIAYHSWVAGQLRRDLPSIPGTLDRELRCNPMLLPADATFRADYAARHGIADDAVQVFSHIRQARNHW